MPYTTIWIALLAIVHVAVIIRVLLNNDIESSARLAWILLIAFLPVVGFIGYILLGEPWIARRFRRLVGHSAKGVPSGQPSGLNQIPDSIPDRFHSAFATCAHIAGCSVSDGNQAILASDSNSAIDAMVADFDAARETIHISFYIWLTDTNGHKVAEAIVRAASRGVTCRVIVDAFGSRGLIRSELWARMAAAGAKLCQSLKPSFGLSPASLSRPDLRNHRKIVVIDDRITYCGSQNCADPEFRIKPKFAPWVDILVRFEGPVALQNQMIFLSDWIIEAGEALSLSPDAPFPTDPGGIAAVAFGTGPMLPRGAMSDAFVALLGCAEREVVISTPYFVPDPQLIAAILACGRRGVDTTLLVPARNDSAIVAAISSAHYPQLLDAGIVVREYQGGLLHAKTLVVDECVTLVGSANMDFRSLHLNFENNILFCSPDFSRAVRDRQNEYIASSVLVSSAEVHSRSSARIAMDNLLTIFGPIY